MHAHANMIYSYYCMRNKVFIYWVCASFFVSLFLALFIGLFDLPDGYFYIIIAQFLYGGTLIPVGPYHLTTPATLFAPLYGLITYPLILLTWPYNVTLISFLQIFLILISSYFLYIIIKNTVTNKYAIIGAVFYILLPFLLIYATTLMSESIGSFMVTVYIFLLYLYVKKGKLFASYLVMWSAIICLTRKSLTPIFMISLCIWVIDLFNRFRPTMKHYDTKILFMVRQIPAIIGIIFVGLWLAFNLRYTGLFSVTNYTGRHLYNNVVYNGHLFPPDDSPIMKTFMNHFSQNKKAMIEPQWEAELRFANDFYNGSLSETQIDNLFLQFSIKSILHNPISYIGHSLRTILGNATQPPYHKYILTYLGHSDPNCPTCSATPCRFDWAIKDSLCKPYFQNSFVNSIWSIYILFNLGMYPIGMSILFLFAFIGIVRTFIQKDLFLRYVSLIFVISFFLESSLETIEGRYILPFYPIYCILILLGIKTLINRARKLI